LKGIVILGFFNCDENKKFCKEHAPAKLPSLKLYPPVPIPPQDFDFELTKAINQAVKYVHNYVTEVKEENF
jgi:hypothetical protein